MKSQSYYYFEDARFQYSLDHLESLLADGKIDADTIVHTICLPFKASDLIHNIAPIINNYLVDEPVKPL